MDELRITSAAGDDGRMAALRAALARLGLGVDLSRSDDAAVLEAACAAQAAGQLPGFGTVAPGKLMRITAKVAPAPAPSSASSGRSSARPAAQPAAPVSDDTFADPIDAEVMAASLTQASQSGAPFVEECSPA